MLDFYSQVGLGRIFALLSSNDVRMYFSENICVLLLDNSLFYKIFSTFFNFFAIKVKNVQTISYNILASGAVPMVLVLIYVLVCALAVNIG